ncbi:DUF4349 domain-containing protein [Tsuneonella rigui]|uniref:DUF4349 domain-containing protein n=1 Tax=Tsuneonella rigui TaxID=1708790 RepID=UPI0013E05FF9|nr:DUF4349 domain-containing protein [Tsuneonella rigui]
MKKSLFLATIGALTLSACSADDHHEQAADAQSSAMSAGEAVEAAAVDASTADGSVIPASMPQLAYDFGLSFRLPSDEIGKLMRRHASVCEQQGPQSCRIVGMDLSGDAEREDVHGTLSLAVASSHARAVSALMDEEASDAGAKQVSATIGSQEVSKQVVDTEAHIRSREQLRDRLTEVLRTRKGSVKELVEAERQVAAVNEEIDQARSWLAETKGRVAFSRMDIDYAPAAAPASDFLAPISSALGSIGGLLGTIIGALIVMLAIALPLLGAALGGRWIVRRLKAPVLEG